MNKGDLIDVVAEKTQLSKKQAELAISATIDTIMDAVSHDKKVTLVGFGSFERRARKAREGRNPKTHQKIMIPATEVPAFSAGKLFKEKVSPAK
jgi:DNA-binding protein HU-beta